MRDQLRYVRRSRVFHLAEWFGIQGADRPERLFRIVRSNPPSVEDFQSAAQRGRPSPDRNRELHDGISCLDTEERARRHALDLPQLGEFIAQLAVPDEAVVRRTLRRAGHYTVWAQAETLLEAVVEVTEVGARVETGLQEMMRDRLFEIWDLESGNAVAEYESSRDAARSLAALAEEHGRASLDGLALYHVEASGTTRAVASNRDQLMEFIARGDAIF